MSKRLQRKETFNLDVANAKRTPEGFLVVPMTATRTGVLTYFRDGQTFKELRLPEEVFSPDSMKSLALKPITDGHPYAEPEGRVDIKNVRRLQVGMVGENITSSDNRFLKATAIITDSEAIKKAEAGKQQVSCGYDKEIEFASGYWDGKEINQDGRGEKFDAIQRNIKYNHVALVNRGRAGEEVRLHLDEDFNLIEEDEIMQVKITVDGKEVEVSADAAEIIKALQTRAADEVTKRKAAEAKITQDTEGKLKLATDEVEALKAENAKLKGSLDAKEAQLTDLQDPVKFNAKVQARSQLIASAKGLMGLDSEDKEKKAALDGLSDLEVMKAALKHITPDLNLDGKGEDYIKGRFDTAADAITADQAGTKKAGATKLGKHLHQTRETQRSEDAAETAQQVAQLAQSKAWKYSVDELRAGKHIADAKKELGVE